MSIGHTHSISSTDPRHVRYLVQQMNLTTKGEKIDLLKHKCFNSRGSAKQCRVAQRSPQELFYDKKKEKCVVAKISMAFRQ